MDNFMIAILVLLVSSFAGRRINQKASEKLNDEQKAKLVTLFSKSGLYRFGVLIVVLALYFLNIKFKWIDLGIAIFVFAIFVLTFLAGTAYVTYKKLKENSFPEEYITKNLLSTLIRILGLIMFFTILYYF